MNRVSDSGNGEAGKAERNHWNNRGRTSVKPSIEVGLDMNAILLF